MSFDAYLTIGFLIIVIIFIALAYFISDKGDD